MNKTTAFLPAFLLFVQLHAQQPIDHVVQAEKNFAAYSVAHGTKAAFLQFLDSNGVVFEKGEAVNGIGSWNKKENQPGVLNWRPQFAGIARSGDFGYTTGPWTFQNSAADTVAARGQFTTVWHKDKHGDWKFLADLGSRNVPANTDSAVHLVTASFHSETRPGTIGSLLKAERRLIKRTSTENSKGRTRQEWYKRIRLTGNGFTVLNRNNRPPSLDDGDLPAVMKAMPDLVSYTILGYGIAPSGDLGYVYGRTLINGNKDNYLRIWKKTQEGWKLAVEVLRY